MTVATQVERDCLRTGEREIFPCDPEPATRVTAVWWDENIQMNGGLTIDTVVNAFQVMIEETELECGIACITPKSGRLAVSRMTVSLHDDFRAIPGFSGAALCTHPMEIAHLANIEEVVPGAANQCRDFDVRVMILDVHRRPVAVVARVVEPVVVIRSKPPELREAFQWELPVPVGHNVLPVSVVPGRNLLINLTLRQPLCLARASDLIGDKKSARPTLVQPEVEHPVHVRPIVVIVGAGDTGRDSREVRWGVDCRLPLSETEIGAAHRPHFFVRPWLRRGPFDGVVPILGL